MTSASLLLLCAGIAGPHPHETRFWMFTVQYWEITEEATTISATTELAHYCLADFPWVGHVLRSPHTNEFRQRFGNAQTVEQNIIAHLFCSVVCMFFKWQYLGFWCVTLITIWAGKIVRHPFRHDPGYGKGKQTKGKSKASIHWAHRFQVSSQLLQCNLVYHIWLNCGGIGIFLWGWTHKKSS